MTPSVGSDARRPAEAEEEAEQRRGRQPDRRHLVDPHVALEQRHQPHEHQAEHDGEHAEHDREGPGVLEEPAAHAGRQHAEPDEDDGEAEHEQRRAGEHPASVRGRPRSQRGPRRRARSCRRGSRAAAGSRRARRRTPARPAPRSGPRPASSRRTPCRAASHPSSAVLGHLLDHVEQRELRRDLAADQRRHPALAVEHHGARHVARVERRREVEQRLAARVVDRRVGDPEACARRPARCPCWSRGC